jgi:hypothetical protein
MISIMSQLGQTYQGQTQIARSPDVNNSSVCFGVVGPNPIGGLRHC